MAILHLSAWWCCGPAFAQAADSEPSAEPAQAASGLAAAPPTASPAAPPTAPRAETAEESKLSFFLRDKDGKLVAMPGWTFEEFEELYQQSRGLAEPNRSPKWVIESLTADGTVRGSHAELTINLGIVLGGNEAASIPLRLDQAVLRAPVEYDGPGQPLVYFDEQTGGYTAILQGKPRQQVHLTLTALVPLSKAGDETRLALAVPRATQSGLTLTVPVAEAVAGVSEGSVLTAATPSDKGTTKIEVQGLGGDFQLNWHKPAGPVAAARPVFEAEGDLSALIDGRSVRTQATLTVRSYGAPFDRFRVRLPANAELLPSEQADYTVEPWTPAETSDSKAAAAAQRVVEVRLPQEQTEQTIVLETRQSLEKVKPTEWFPLGGFEVLEAARQWGEIAVSVVGDLYVFWGPQLGVEQVERSPVADWDEQLVGTFQYHTQPFKLSVRVAPRKTRLSVEPQYVVSVAGDRASLQATLKYTVRGAKVSSLDVQMPGWTVDDAGPYDDLVAMGGVAIDPSGLVSVALSEPMTGELVVNLTAHQEITRPDASIRLALPKPVADSVGPAAVAVLAADNVELVPDAEGTTGLTRQLVAPPMNLPERYQQPLFYRAETTDAVFAAAVHLHARSIQVRLAADVSLLSEQQRVQETLNYTVAYERVQELELDVPQAVAAAKGLEVFLDGQPVTLADAAEAVGAAPSSDTLAKRVVLPEPRIGPIELVVRYPIEMEKLRAETSILCTIPLVTPRQGELAGNTVVVTAERGVTVGHRQEGWNVVETDAPARQRGEVLRLTSDQKRNQLVLGVSLEDRDALGSTVVQRAWIQTWLWPSVRQDRAVFSLVGNQKSVEIIVPAGVDLDRLSLTLNGQPAEVERTAQNSLIVPLSPEASGQVQQIELRYQILQARGRPGRTDVELPRLGRDVWVQRMYWQLMMPANEHVVVPPAGMVPEYRWGWTGTFWGRIPLLDQRALEEWSGAAPVDPASSGTSCYLFGSLGAVRQAEFRTASRPLIVLIASGMVLALGLVWIYLPAAHHPVTLLAVSLVVLSASLLYPGPMLLLLQAASLGVALILFAALLHRSIARRRGLLSGETSSSILDRGSTHTVRPAPPINAQVSTRTLPDAVPVSTPESESQS